jgi:NAD(P)-dependent dehydrogenase (short-subunit alcohol dehydrogenase family)
VYCVQADLADERDTTRLVEIALARFDVIDHVIHLAADTRFHGRLLELAHSGGYAAAQLKLNTVSPLYLTSSIFDLCWKDDREGNLRMNRSVVTVSSGSSVYVLPDTTQALYGASKAALNLLTLYAAAELAPYNVRANVVCPGGLREKPKLDETVQTIERLLASQATGEFVQLC